jgi:hypothetical protein
MTDEVENLYIEANTAKELLKVNAITYEEAKRRVMPYLNKLNQVGKEKAKKFGLKARTVSFPSFIR